MSTFQISSCLYDGSAGGSGDSNPLCMIYGTVNGKNVFAQVFFKYLMAANAAGQMQQALSAIMFNWYVIVYGYTLAPVPQFIKIPVYPPVAIIASQTQGPYPQPPVSVPEALIGSWVA
jgi:hypothetical protein